jgi:hypothetical protein
MNSQAGVTAPFHLRQHSRGQASSTGSGGAPLATVEKTRHARGGLFGLFTL